VNTAPDNAELLERLAAEYVLGTLRGAARRRLERWRRSSTRLDDYCHFWEDRLMPLVQELPPRAPPEHLWRKIEERLGLKPSTPQRPLLKELAIAASVLLMAALAVLMLARTLAPGRAAEVATVSSSGALLWQVEVFNRGGAPQRLAIRASRGAQAPHGRDYELWALPDGGKPVSLGVLPYRETSTHPVLSALQMQAIATSRQLAVSLEPSGGSPTGQPTGPVLFVVALHPVS
jgi:anti-sigma-K factor RskA